MDQETGFSGPAGVLCPGGMEVAGSEDSLFMWEAGSDGYSDVDVEGLGTVSSSFMGRAFWSFPKRSLKLFIVSPFIVAWGNQGGGMVDCFKWLLLLQEVDEKKMVCRNV